MSSLLKRFRRRRQQGQPGTPPPKAPETDSTSTSPYPRFKGSVAPPQRVLPQTHEYLDDSQDAPPLLVEAKTQYNKAIMAFDKVFELYASKNPNVVKIDETSIAEGAQHALSCTDTSQSAKVFGETVQRILQTNKAYEMQPSFGKQVCSVLSKLFPLIKLALGLTERVADV